ncbi:MAG: Gfo/Idh/MocA family protein, partial [Alphaproteobacteria bacterium]
MATFTNPVIETLGRRLRLGVVGGGARSFVGAVHRTVARLDNRYELVATALSSSPERGREQGVQAGVVPDRAYGGFDEMLEREGARADGIDVVAIMTPNHHHYPQCKAALAKGLHIICDKPMTTSLADALDLVKLVREAGVVFCLTHNYSGFPMVRQARAMIAAGALGEIRQVNVEYTQGQLSSLVEVSTDLKEGLKWRLDKARGGPSAVLGDIGTHAHQLLTYFTGIPLARLCADVGATVPQRQNDDYAGMLLRLENGARGTLWATQAASGSENVLRVKVFGSEGGLEWEQNFPN